MWTKRYQADQMILALSGMNSKFNGYSPCKFVVIKSNVEWCMESVKFGLVPIQEMAGVFEWDGLIVWSSKRGTEKVVGYQKISTYTKRNFFTKITKGSVKGMDQLDNIQSKTPLEWN